MAQLSKSRIEAFSDGVIAIIITIMVLELHIPEISQTANDGALWNALWHLVPKISAYLLSFVVVGILWINHHTLFDKLPHSTTGLVWYNAFLLFSMSLIPLPTAFLAENLNRIPAVMFYGMVMFLNAFAFFLMRQYIEKKAKLIPYNEHIHRSNLMSTLLYAGSVPLAILSVYFSYFIFLLIPVWYFLPDKRVASKK